MNILSGLTNHDDQVPIKFRWFFQATWQPEVCCMQDALHILVKLYRRLVKHVLLMGNKIISINFIRQLLQDNDRRYGVCLSDLASSDAMNVKIAEKIGSERIIAGLEENVAGSEALVVYLQIMMWIKQSYIEAETTASNRLYLSWKIVFVCRIWREFILSSKNRSLKDFISANTYNCVEINAHSMLVFLIDCREKNREEIFKVAKTGSQACESFFAKERSQTTTQSTITNFDMSEMLARSKRTEMIEIAQAKATDFKFSRMKSSSVSGLTLPLPSNQEIDEIISKAFVDACIILRAFGKITFLYKPAI